MVHLPLKFDVLDEQIPVAFREIDRVKCALQEKTVTPSTEEQTILPDPGFDGLSVVKVDPAKRKAKFTFNKSGSSITAFVNRSGGSVIAGISLGTSQTSTIVNDVCVGDVVVVRCDYSATNTLLAPSAKTPKISVNGANYGTIANVNYTTSSSSKYTRYQKWIYAIVINDEDASFDFTIS